MSLPMATPCEYVMGAMRLINNFSKLVNARGRDNSPISQFLNSLRVLTQVKLSAH